MPAKLSRHLDGLQTDATCAVVAFSMHKFCHARSFLPSLSICSGKKKKEKYCYQVVPAAFNSYKGWVMNHQL